MKGDFTRDTFDPAKHFSRVLMQQGRVQLDADWNEQAAILLHYLQTLAADLIGPHAGPDGANLGFEIKANGRNFSIGAGRYYVDGLLCENEFECDYSAQLDYPLPADHSLDLDNLLGEATNHIAYVDVWERHLTYLDDGLIREVALGGPDTATRAKVVWQVKLIIASSCDEAEKTLQDGADLNRRAKMKAQLDPGTVNPDPCITAPDLKYRGAENQLYRVEIHQLTTNNDGQVQDWSFKWSRENGSVLAAWLGTADDGGQLVSSSRGFEVDNWVEITSDIEELHNVPGKLTKIVKVEAGALTFDPPLDIEWKEDVLVKFRRWDQTEIGDVVLTEGAVPGATDQWLDLEDGLQVWFDFDRRFSPR